jgi:hypothetical protein
VPSRECFFKSLLCPPRGDATGVSRAFTPNGLRPSLAFAQSPAWFLPWSLAAPGSSHTFGNVSRALDCRPCPLSRTNEIVSLAVVVKSRHSPVSCSAHLWREMSSRLPVTKRVLPSAPPAARPQHRVRVSTRHPHPLSLFAADRLAPCPAHNPVPHRPSHRSR